MLVLRKINRTTEHILFWLAYWVFLSFSAGLYDLDFITVSLYALSHLPLTIITTYLFVYKILPFFFQEKKLLFFLTTMLLIISALLLKRTSIQYFQFPLFYANEDWTFTFFEWYRIVGHLLQIGATIGLISALKLYREWRRTQDKLDILQTEKRKLELNYLKAQTNPHFLFNTLNSIYYNVVNKTSDSAAKSIIQLSELLRFVLYECKEDFIPIEKEIQLINNYIELQKSRYQDRLTVNLLVNGNLKEVIPPLICFSLIENAFKHGMSESIGECIIEITIQIDTNNFSICIKNPISESIDSYSSGSSKGLGLINVNRQLTLIYNDTYKLTDKVENNTYICVLEIPINNK